MDVEDGDPAEDMDQFPEINANENKYGDGLQHLNIVDTAPRKHKPKARPSARARASDAVPVAKEKESKGPSGGEERVDNCINFLNSRQEGSDSNNLADKLKANAERSKITKPKTKEGRKQDENNTEEKGDKIGFSGSSGDHDHQSKRDSGGKLQRGRSPPRGIGQTPCKERDSSLGKKVYRDMLADDDDDDDDSEDSVMDMSSKLKGLVGGAINHERPSETPMLKLADEGANQEKNESEKERPRLSPRHMGLERARSERALSRSKSPKRTNSGEVAAKEDSGLASALGIAKPTLSRTASESKSPVRRPIPRTKSGAESRPGPGLAKPGLARSVSVDDPNARGGLARSLSRRGLMRSKSPGPKRPEKESSPLDMPDMKRGVTTGAICDQLNGGLSVGNNATPTRRDRSLTRHNSRRNLSRTRSQKDVRSVSPSRGGCLGEIEKDSLLDSPVEKLDMKRCFSGGDTSAPRTSGSGPRPRPRRKGDLEAASEHVPRRRGQRSGQESSDDNESPSGRNLKRNDSVGSTGSSGARPRRPRMAKALSEKNMNSRSPVRTRRNLVDANTDSEASLDPGSKSNNELGTSTEHRRRKPRERTEKLGDGRSKRSDDPNGEPEEGTRRRRKVQSGDEAESGDKHRRRHRRPEGDGERSPGRKTSNREEDGEVARSGDGRRRKPRRRHGEEDKSDGDITGDDSPGRARSPREDGERSRGRRGRKADGQGRGASPTRNRNPRAQKGGARHQQDIARNQFANMVNYYDHADDEEEESEAAPPEEEPIEAPAVETQEDAGKKKGGGLLGSAFGAVAKTALMAASTATHTASSTAKLGAKVASKTTQMAVTTAQEGVNLAGKAVTNLGQQGQNVLLHTSEHNAARDQRAHQPVSSITDLEGGPLGGSSSGLLDMDEDSFA